MDKRTKELFEARAIVVKAMAHPTRLYIVDRLAQREHCVCELTELIGVDTSTVSKHLSVLRNAGIVESDKRGTEIFYALRVPCVLKFFSCIEGVLKNNAQEKLRLIS